VGQDPKLYDDSLTQEKERTARTAEVQGKGEAEVVEDRNYKGEARTNEGHGKTKIQRKDPEQKTRLGGRRRGDNR